MRKILKDPLSSFNNIYCYEGINIKDKFVSICIIMKELIFLISFCIIFINFNYIMNLLQKGGLEPLTKVPKFKYTFDEKRKIFIGHLYPYAEYFIRCVTSMPFNSYTYNGNCEYILFEDKTQIVSNCSSSGPPLYFFLGGVVYELLNKKFNNVDLYNYCDATGDIDVTLYPPKLTYYENQDIDFLNKDGKISSFYLDFTRWTFENMVKNVQSIELLFRDMQNLVNFNIDEYNEIPTEHKSSDFGYINQQIGKFYVVAFLNEDKTMFKIQVVCKIEDSGVSVIDHVIEIIIPLPESSNFFIPTSDDYSHPSIDIITINGTSFNIDNYNSLILGNITSYISRKNAYGQTNEREVIHKSINHIARLFYLYELIYKNQTSFQLDKLNLIMLYGYTKKDQQQLQFLYYYKIVGDKFNTIKVDTRFFLNSYFELILINKYSYTTFTPNFFINYSDINDVKILHDRFITELFNEPLGLLTFSDPPSAAAAAVGGKKSKKTRKLRKMRKKRHTKNMKKKVISNRTTVKRLQKR